MSGSGLCSRRRQMRIAPDFAAEIERDAAIDHVRRKIAVEQKLGCDGSERLIRVLDELANDLDQGFHLPDGAR